MPKSNAADASGDDEVIFQDQLDDGAKEELRLPKVDVVFADDTLDDDDEIVGPDDEDDEEAQEEEEGDFDEDGEEEDEDEKSAAHRRELEEARRIAREADERASAREAELAEKEKDNHTFQLAFANSQKNLAERDLKSFRSELAKAKEEGETDREIELQDMIDKAVKERDKYDTVIDNLKANPPKEKTEKKAEAKTDSAKRGEHPTVRDWLSKNRWYTHPTSKEEEYRRNLATRIDDEMLAEGKHDNTSEEYFKELNRRLKMEQEKTRGQRGKADGQKKRNPVSKVGGGGESKKPSHKSNKVVITRSDQKMMKIFGLDPRKENELKEYAHQKRRLERRDGSGYGE